MEYLGQFVGCEVWASPVMGPRVVVISRDAIPEFRRLMEAEEITQTWSDFNTFHAPLMRGFGGPFTDEDDA